MRRLLTKLRLALGPRLPPEVLAAARRPALAPATVVVILAAATMGLTGVLAISGVLSFPPPAVKAYGWVTLHRYPKEQELFYFLLTVVGVPAWTALVWRIWLTVSWWLARAARSPLGTVLQQNAAAALCLLAPWPRLLRLDHAAWDSLVPATATLAGLLVVFFLFNRFARPPLPTTPGVTPTPESPRQPRPTRAGRRWPRITWRIVSGLVVYAVVPALLYLLRRKMNIDGFRNLSLFHDGEFLEPLDTLLRGGVPYRDVYLQHGLFHNAWIPALGAHLFGPTLAGVRTIMRLLDPLGGVALYFLVVALFRGRLLAGLTVGWIICGAIKVPFRATFGLLALACVAAVVAGPHGLALHGDRTGSPAEPPGRRRCATSRRSAWLLVTAGFFSMLAFWHSLEVGLYTIAAIGLFLTAASFLPPGFSWRRRPLPLAAYVAGLLVGFWSIGGYFLGRGALDDLLHNVYVQSAYQWQTWGLAFPKLADALDALRHGPAPLRWPDRFAAGPILWYLPAAVFLLGNLYLAYRAVRGGFWRSPAGVRLLLLLLASVCFFRSVLGRSDGSHLYYGILFMVLVALYLPDQLFSYGFGQLVRRGAPRSQRLRGAACLLLGALVAWPLYRYVTAAYHPQAGLAAGWERLRHPPRATRAVSERVPRAGTCVIPRREARRIDALVRAIRAYTPRDGTVYDFTDQAALLFFADRPSASRYFHASYASTDALQEEVIAALERQRTPLVLAPGDRGRDGMDGFTQEQRHPLLAAYLKTAYRETALVEDVRLLVRRE